MNMMMAPQTYIDNMRKESLASCLQERDEIYAILKKVENNEYPEEEIDTTVHPVIQYRWYLEVFALLNQLIADKFVEERD